MKKLLLLLSIISTGAYAASIDHIQTYSPDYLANQAQTGITQAGANNYNPAGTTRWDKGQYVHVGLQFATGYEKMEYKGIQHKAQLRQAIPNVALTSVDDNGAYFFNFGGIAGGGKLKYDGVSGLDVLGDTDKLAGVGVYDKGSEVKGSNKYEQITLGRAFKVDDKLSFSVAGRVVHGTRNLNGNLNVGINPSQEYMQKKGMEIAKKVSEGVDAKTKGLNLPSAKIAAMKQQETEKNLATAKKETAYAVAKGLQGDLDAKREAWGYGFQLGVNYKATDKLNLAARYDSRIKMDFKSKGHENKLPTEKLLGTDLGLSTFYPQYTPGTRTRRDLPAILSVGASYQATDNYLVSFAGNYYFNRHAKMDRVQAYGGNEHGYDYKNGWELALGNEYKINDKFTVLGSVNYARTGAKSSSYNDTEYALNSYTLGAGVKYNYDETLAVTASVAHFIYDKKDGAFTEKFKGANVENQKYRKSITAVGLSVTKKF